MSIGTKAYGPDHSADAPKGAMPHKHVFSKHPGHGDASKTAAAANPNPFAGNQPPSPKPGSPKVK